jgi:hypothetical protein
MQFGLRALPEGWAFRTEPGLVEPLRAVLRKHQDPWGTRISVLFVSPCHDDV